MREEETMVIGWLPGELNGGDPSQSAWAQVEAVQSKVRLPCLLIPQPAHAVVAGELAAGLLSTCFGALPAEIVRAIQMHDTGWAVSDAQQIHRLRSVQAGNAVPISFVAIAPAEAAEAWTASIDSVETFSKVGAIIVSRHFSLLAQHDPTHHRRFIQAELLRQGRIQAGTAKTEDLDRWTAALGFCDLVSLYLLSGLSGEVEFPLAHPASPLARTSPRVNLQIDGRNLRFTPETVRAGCTLTIQALNYPLAAPGARTETLHWEVQ
jgi:Protein of unknown function (DUF3891)